MIGRKPKQQKYEQNVQYGQYSDDKPIEQAFRFADLRFLRLHKVSAYKIIRYDRRDCQPPIQKMRCDACINGEGYKSIALKNISGDQVRKAGLFSQTFFHFYS